MSDTKVEVTSQSSSDDKANSQEAKEQKQKLINEFKANVNLVLDAALSNIFDDKNNNTSIPESNNTSIPNNNLKNTIKVFKSDTISAQFLKLPSKAHRRRMRLLNNNNNTNSTIDQDFQSYYYSLSRQNQMASVDPTYCEEILRAFYNISDDQSLLLKQVEFDSTTNLDKLNDTYASSGVAFEYFHPQTQRKLNSSICSNITTPVKIPFKQEKRINIDLYQKSLYLSSIIDIYNSQSPGYYSRCLKSDNIDTGADTSINYRRTVMFQNASMECSAGCTYEGLDENKYVKCNCKTDLKQEMSNSASEGPFLSMPPMNYDIVLCYKETYYDVYFIY